MRILFEKLALVIVVVVVYSSYANCQTGFVENKGQFPESLHFRGDFKQYQVALNQKGFLFSVHDDSAWAIIAHSIHEYNLHKRKDNLKIADSMIHKLHNVQYEFIGANWTNYTSFDTIDGYYNYFLDNDPSQWAGGVKRFEKVIYKNIYPNIDIEFIAADLLFKYNLILNEGANIEDIKIKIVGAPFTISGKQIKIHTTVGDVLDNLPVSYYSGENNEKILTDIRYKQEGDIITLQYTSGFRRNKPLVIDPELIFATYSGSTQDNFGFTATYDNYGNAYAGGIVLNPLVGVNNSRYPTTPGAFQTSYAGGGTIGPKGAESPNDIAISVYNKDGSKLLYATYLGGKSNEFPHSMIVDQEGQLIVFGTVYSLSFPTTSDAYQSQKVGSSSTSDMFITKFSKDGTSLIGSTYLGGAENDGLNQSTSTKDYYADDFRGEINLDKLGNIYVASVTESTDFPTTSNAIQKSQKGGQEGVVFCLSADIKNLLWSTYLGGSGDDAVYSIDVSNDQQYVYVSGGTSSNDMPVTPGTFQDTRAGSTDGFIAKLKIDGSAIERLTYIGTERYDQLVGLEINTQGEVYVIGQTSGRFPIKGDVYANENSGQFIAKLDKDLSTTIFSTTFGSGKGFPDITVNAFLVDNCGKIYISGWGADIKEQAQKLSSNMPITPDAIRKTTDGNDFYLAVFSPDVRELIYATYLGGFRTGDHVDGGTSRFDKEGVVYQSVCASCPKPGERGGISDFPTSRGVFSEKNPSPRCSNLVFKFGFETNKPPLLADSFYTISILDTLRFSYQVLNPERDTLDTRFKYSTGAITEFLNPREYEYGISQTNTNFTFVPTCDMAGDTIKIKVNARDRGCPVAKDSNATIRIAVNPMPLIDPPKYLCLKFTEDDKYVLLSWENFTPTRYFKTIHLYRIDPNGNETLLRSFKSKDSRNTLDDKVINPTQQNYEYYIRIENICEQLGPQSSTVSTTKEFEIPIKSTYMETATVVENKYVQIKWLPSKEEDFYAYRIYKKQRTFGEWEVLTNIYKLMDTSYVDKKVNVSENSYCYRIVVLDGCGNRSLPTNEACNIVLRGTSPPFQFELNWDFYRDWPFGVKEYTLFRSVDTGSLRNIITTPSTLLSHVDDLLDFDWGGYWYKVIAYENAGGQEATSESNAIYLIQPPLLWVPNAFTSNNDNLNDKFGWKDVFVKDFEMTIFNRWGEKVFQSNDKNAKWDGTSKSSTLHNSDVYVWMVTYTGWDRSRHHKKGTVTIIR